MQLDKIDADAYWFGPLTFGVGMAGFWMARLFKRSCTKKLKQDLEEPCRELAALAGFLEKYSGKIKRITQSLFSSVGEDSLKNFIFYFNIINTFNYFFCRQILTCIF